MDEAASRMISRLTLLFCVALLGACAKEPAARSVLQFIENPLLLEAAMVRCAQDRTQTKYDPECVNARQAASIIEAREEAKRADELEALSESKRRALRQTQEAAAEARRRALAAEERRKNQEYIEQFGEPPPVVSGEEDSLVEGNLPIAVVPKGEESPSGATPAGEQSQPGDEEGTN
ncbi:MAG: EexN family lipoprotein [Gammaproteobacteria bacterium]|nr:EexN family lipoprotein [Gammaproteobacteria bacterium]